MASRYREKPPVVEAIQLTPLNIDEVEVFVGGKLTQTDVDSIIVTPLGPTLRVSMGDFVVKGAQEGEFYSRKPDIFEATYEKEDSQ